MRFWILLFLLLSAAPILAQDKQRSAACQEKFQADPDNRAAQFEKASKTEGPGRYGKLPDFEFPGLKRADLDNRVVVMDFWASWCAPCVAEIPQFNEFQKQNPNDLRVLGFSYDKEPAEIKADYPSFLTSTPEVKQFLRQLFKQVGPVKAIPVTLLVDRQGEIIYRQTGEIGDEFKNALQTELSRR